MGIANYYRTRTSYHDTAVGASGIDGRRILAVNEHGRRQPRRERTTASAGVALTRCGKAVEEYVRRS